MDSDLIAYETMLAAKDSAEWAWWTMAAALAAVFISLATLGFAYEALNSWREQEKLKLKMEFKRAILELSFSLDDIPQVWYYNQINTAKARLKAAPELASSIGDQSEIYFKKKNLVDSFNEATKAWLMCGHLFEEEIIRTTWRQFSREFRPYIMRGGNKSSLTTLISKLGTDLKII
ncbi:MAG: hypothetical protein EOO84_10960 [Pantoea sp.]|uniref:hypothetical protein n=1 Tax=Pantoea sp. TaxID=69393 RepID=UPI00120D5AD8|nr:hypothetical protein [Pantoea sp.]RZK07202.1 MAG: hypothetical protein EOO84_10960 [Pantoea sp.]